ncbi:MAG TPA: hypothetical protein VL361_02715 [Candidatus Limnocylindrales bacterium]|nr:hypothetical protein [Candidatus Limnocylindrales bacterium]
MTIHVSALKSHWPAPLHRARQDSGLWESLAIERRRENAIWLVLGCACLALVATSFVWMLLHS